jgi:hypothetical protein
MLSSGPLISWPVPQTKSLVVASLSSRVLSAGRMEQPVDWVKLDRIELICVEKRDGRVSFDQWRLAESPVIFQWSLELAGAADVVETVVNERAAYRPVR